MNGSEFIARRFFSLSRKSLSSTSLRLAVVSVALAVAVMIIAWGVVIGFKNQIRDKVLGFEAPIHIVALDKNESIEENPFVLDSSLKSILNHTAGIRHYQMVADKAGIIKTDEEIQGVVLKGVDEHYDWSYFSNCLVAGMVPKYTVNERSTEVMISKNIADKMLLGLGDPVRVWFIDNDMKARGRKFDIVGIYQTGLTEFDDRYVFGDLNQIRRLNEWPEQATGKVEVWVDNADMMESVNDALYFSLPVELASYTVRETNTQIFDWLALLDTNVWLIMALMLLVAGITVVSMLLIFIIERTSTIGVLKAMGATNQFVRNVLLYRSLRILFAGMIIGNIVGLGFCFLQYYTAFIKLPAETYYLSSVPVELHAGIVIVINLGTLLLWTLMLLIPTAVINRITPIKALRFE